MPGLKFKIGQHQKALLLVSPFGMESDITLTKLSSKHTSIWRKELLLLLS